MSRQDILKSPSSDGQHLIELERAGVRQGEKWLVRGVDLSVSRGEIVTLIGPNGSGKSSTAKLALGILKPSEGRASRSGKLRVGYVPQKLHIDWTMPLNVSRFMELTSKLSEHDKLAALERTKVAHLLKSEVRNLSGGELQRVLLARAIARKPDLLVLDEPVQGVDQAGEVAIYDLISEVRREFNCGVLMISHDLHVVMAATDHVICLNGHVCCRGTPTAVSQSAEFQSLFGQRAGLAVYQHNHDHVHLPDGRVRHADGRITEDCAGELCDSGDAPCSDHSHVHDHNHDHDHDRHHDHAHTHSHGKATKTREAADA